MAHSPVALVVLAAACLLGACGSAGHSGSALSPSSVKSCLTSHGLRVLGGPVDKASRGNSGASAELIARNSFIVFYPSVAVADRHAAVLRANAARLRGSITRRGAVTVLFVGIDLPPGPRQTILRCA